MIEKFAKVPPEKISRSPRSWFPANKFFNCAVSTPATGTCAKIRKTRKIPKVKRIFFRTSGDFQLLRSVLRNEFMNKLSVTAKRCTQNMLRNLLSSRERHVLHATTNL